MNASYDASFLRLFVALEVPQEVKERIAAAQTDLKNTVSTAALSWTRPEQFHLTMRFLGNVESTRVGALVEALHQCQEVAPFLINAEGLGFFPTRKRPRVVWAGLQTNSEALPELHRRIQDVTNPFTGEIGESSFKSHVTIARVKEANRDVLERLRAAVETAKGMRFGTWIAREVLLMRSQLSSKGATHSAVASFPLGQR